MTNLRDTALGLFQVALDAADPAQALRRAVAQNPLPRPGPGGAYLLVAVGKAAVAMAEAAMKLLVDAPVRALVVTNYENARDVPGARVMASGHPVPDENGRIAGEAVAELLESATETDRVIALISGGGSALLPAPAAQLTLDDKAAVNRLLLANGYDISEINLIRQQLSRLKGGGMLRLAAPAPVTAFILSDVIGDDLRVIASGPTVAPLGTPAKARTLLEARGVWANLPAAVRQHLSAAAPDDGPRPEAGNILIGSNKKSLESVVNESKNLNAAIISDALVGDVGAACDLILDAATHAPKDRLSCLIFGGETTVVLRGTGLGGRNQELALRMALAGPAVIGQRDWVFLSGGTDGRDGPTEAAGGIVDAQTADRIRATGAAPETLLANNDSNAALAAAGDLLMTGATGTNVADVQILILGPVRH